MAPLQLPIGAVAARYSISTRTVDRWLADPRVGFPQPLRVRDRRYWRIADLEILGAREGCRFGKTGGMTWLNVVL